MTKTHKGAALLGKSAPLARLARGGGAGARRQSPGGDALSRPLHRARIHFALPGHRPAGFRPSGDRLCARRLAGRIQVAEALSRQRSATTAPSTRTAPCAIGKDRRARSTPRWLRIGGYWYPRGGIPIDVFWQTGAPPEGPVAARPGRAALSRARLSEDAERHREKMAKRKAVQDARGCRQDGRREGPADRPHRHRQGQIDRRLRHGHALSGPRHARRRRAVRQGRVGDRRAKWLEAVSRSGHLPRHGRRLHMGDAGPHPRHRRRARGLGGGQGDDRRSRFRLVLLDELNIALRYDYLPLDEVIAALQAQPRDLHVVVTGPQRQARTDRDRRSRHRDDARSSTPSAPASRRRRG